MKPITVKSLILVAAVAMLPISTLAAPPPPDEQSYSQPQSGDRYGKAGKMSKEEKLAWKAEMKEQMRGMSKDQRKAFRQQAKEQFKALDSRAREQRLASLDQQWKSMSPGMQQKMLSKSQHRGAKHAQAQDGGGKAGKHKNRQDDDSAPPQQ